MKVNIPNQKTAKKYKHDRSHDVSTTSDFGFLQPLMVDEVSANSTVSCRVGQICRMMPLVKPTFGQMDLKTYHVFIPMESIFHPYASFRAGQTYMGANATYIPTQVITLNLGLLNYLLKIYSNIGIIKLDIQNLSGPEYVEYDKTQSTWVTPASTEFNTVRSAWDNTNEQAISQSALTYNLRTIINRQFPYLDTSASVDASAFDWVDMVHNGNDNYLVVGKYTIFAKNLRKIFYGCGYKLINDYEKISALPLFAFYKAYFDLFAPQRDITWKDTAGAGLQEWMEQYGRFDMLSSNGVITQKTQLFINFIEDLGKSYYTKSPDFVSSHITGQRISTVPNTAIKTMSPYDGQVSLSVGTLQGSITNSGVSIGTTVNNGGNIQYLSSVSNSLLNQSNLDILQRMYHRVNANTPIGGDIRLYMKAMLGSDYLDEDDSFWIGATSVDLNIDPIFNQAETSEGYLGQFAGAGQGGNHGQTFTYNAKVDGYWIALATIVPQARMAQGVDMQLKHVGRYDFYDPAFDSLTLLPTPKKYIFAENNFHNFTQTAPGYNDSFGNIPNYMEYCVKQNLINGDMSLMSTRASYLPFNLDMLLPYTECNENSSTNTYEVSSTPMNFVVNGTIWRYIGLYQWLGMYNRIFVNSGHVVPTQVLANANSIFYSVGWDDNFIIHNYFDYSIWSTKLPCRDAFQTGAFDKDSLSIEKA